MNRKTEGLWIIILIISIIILGFNQVPNNPLSINELKLFGFWSYTAGMLLGGSVIGFIVDYLNTPKSVKGK